MKKYLAGAAFAVLLTVAAVPADVRAETTTTTGVSGMLELLQNLMKQVEVLQKQLAELRGEIKSELKDGLHEGMSDDDVKKVQELLATDTTIYPKGLISGYFGPQTKEAIIRFQTRHGLEATGEVDSETKELMLEYFKERANGKFPLGLLRAPGIDKKMLERLREGRDGKKHLNCDDRVAAGPLCKDEDEDEDMNDEDEDEDEDEDNGVATTTQIKTTATTAINAAKTAIEALEDAIAEADDEEAIEEAEDEQVDAEEYLSKAEDLFTEGKYRNAYYKAVKAKSEASKALRELL